MILPRLCINKEKYSVELYYPDEPDEPITIISGTAKSSYNLLWYMLEMFYENYIEGYEAGYTDAVDDEGV